MPALVTVVVLIAWEAGVRAGILKALFFPAPTTIIRTLAKMIANGDLFVDLGATLSRLGQGLLLGSGVGLLVGLVMGWSRPLREVVDPFIAAAHPIPKISILPLVMIVFGIGEASKVVLVAIASFFPTMINTMAGVRQIHPIHFEVAGNFGAGLGKTFTRVLVPGSLPLILTGLRLALNTALVVTIAVELLTAREGLGATIWLAWETLRTEDLYVALLTTALLGISFNQALRFLAQRLIPWQEK